MVLLKRGCGSGGLTIVQLQRGDAASHHAAGRGRAKEWVGLRRVGDAGEPGQGVGVRAAVEGLERRVVSGLGEQFQADGGRPLPLGPPVLVPRLDLGVGEVELGRQLLAVLDAQILLLLEAPLEGLQLVVGESSARFPLLPRMVVVRVRAAVVAFRILARIVWKE